MQHRFCLDMVEATRLTRSGQLTEATTLIQRALQGATARAAGSDPEVTSARRDPVTIDGVAEVVTESPGDGAPNRPSEYSTGRPSPAPDARPSRPGLRELLRSLRRDRGLVGEGIPLGRRARTPVPVPTGARYETGSFTTAAGIRSYKLYVPSGYCGEPTVLVVMLHGCTQDADDLAVGTRMNEHAERRGFLVVYPEQAVGANQSRCWNWFRASDQVRDQGEPSLIAGITRQVMADYAVAPGRVYLAGMSAGGAMAMVMAATHPDLYAAVGVHSGLAHGAASDLPSALAAMRQGTATSLATALPAVVPTIVFHGDQDAVVHPGNGDLIVERAEGACREPADRLTECGQIPGRRRHTRTVIRDRRGRALVEHWLIHGAGHAWSGGSAQGSYCDPSGPDASAEMLRFFFDDVVSPGSQ